jgi:hypothetical protein
LLVRVHGVRRIMSGRHAARPFPWEGPLMAGVPFAHKKNKIGEMGSGHAIELRNRTVAILIDAGNEVGLDLVGAVTQGSWCKGCVGDSKGFHDGAGVFDLSSSVATDEVELALRKRGVAAWIRPKNGFPSRHIHGVDAFDPNLDDKTQGQVNDYHNGLAGLAGDQDTDPHLGDLHPTLVKFPDPGSELEMELMTLNQKTLNEIGQAVVKAKVKETGEPTFGIGGQLRAAAKRSNDAIKAADAATKAADAGTKAANAATKAADAATKAANAATKAAILAAKEAARARKLAEATATGAGMTTRTIQALLIAADAEVAQAIAPIT